MENKAIVYACSDQYFEITFASVKSLLQSNDCTGIKLYLLSDNVSGENCVRFKDYMSQKGVSVAIIDIYDYLAGIANLNSVEGSFTTYGRLFIADVCQEDRVLYIDSDTYVNGSITELFFKDMKGKAIGGVQDCIDSLYYDMIGLSKTKYRYINGGILLLDLKVWREQNCSNRLVKYLNEHTEIPNFDQGVINDIFRDDICILELKYNVLPQIFYFKDDNKIRRLCGLKVFYDKVEVLEAVKAPSIVHFTGSGSTPYLRPWMTGAGVEHPYAQRFLGNYNGTISTRKWSFNIMKHKFFSKMPFAAYLMFEKILKIRRNKIIKKTAN